MSTSTAGTVWLVVGITLIATGIAVAGGVGLAQWSRARDRRRWERAGFAPLPRDQSTTTRRRRGLP